MYGVFEFRSQEYASSRVLLKKYDAIQLRLSENVLKGEKIIFLMNISSFAVLYQETSDAELSTCIDRHLGNKIMFRALHICY